MYHMDARFRHTSEAVFVGSFHTFLWCQRYRFKQWTLLVHHMWHKRMLITSTHILYSEYTRRLLKVIDLGPNHKKSVVFRYQPTGVLLDLNQDCLQARVWLGCCNAGGILVWSWLCGIVYHPV